MKKYMDKLIKKIKCNKKGLLFLFGISVVGFIFGVFFLTLISKTDQELVKKMIKSYIDNINNIDYFDTFKNCFIENFLFIFIIWILGMSVIGIPITIFYYFIKTFTLGFLMSAFILTYKIKGILYSIIYIIPSNLFNILIFTILLFYSINFSLTLIMAITKKKNLNFKNIINKYTIILLFSLISILISSLYETFIVPLIMKLII